MDVQRMEIAELVNLVNEWGTEPCRVDGRAPRPGSELTVLADELHPIFQSPDPATRASMVTTLLETTGVRPELRHDDGVLIDSWTVSEPAQARRAAAALALRQQLAENPGRLGLCADDQCADVYVDASPAGKRRFCCLTCQNRARAATFRRRRAARNRQDQPGAGLSSANRKPGSAGSRAQLSQPQARISREPGSAQPTASQDQPGAGLSSGTAAPADGPDSPR